MRFDGVKGQLDLLLLAVLDRGPCHGYAVIVSLREQSAGVLDLTEGSVYPALHRLENLGLVTSEWVPVAGRRRRLYRLTPDGRAALKERHREWRSVVRAVDAILRPSPAASAATS